MRIGLRLPACDRADKVAAAAADAEAAGFDSVWVPDSQLLWRDTFVALTPRPGPTPWPAVTR